MVDEIEAATEAEGDIAILEVEATEGVVLVVAADVSLADDVDVVSLSVAEGLLNSAGFTRGVA